MAGGGALQQRDLQPGDVLLFRQPDPGVAWKNLLEHGSSEQQHGKTEESLRQQLHFHDLIAALDGCQYTHAALVTQVRESDVEVGNSDENKLRLERLDAIRWEYGHTTFTVLRLRRGGLGDEAYHQQVAAIVAEAAGLAEPAREYPAQDMLPAGHLLTLRTQPVQLPCWADADLALRYAADEAQAEVVARWREQLRERASMPDVSYGFMCAAYVAKAFEGAGCPLKPAVRPAGRARQCPQLGGDAVDFLVRSFHRWAYDETVPEEQVRAQLEAAMAGEPTYVDQRWVEAWSAHLGEAVSAPGRSGTLQDVRPVAALFTAYDLEHSDQLELVGECVW